MTVSGDGSALETGASGRGKRLCDCPRNEKYECDRSYSDPSARWGWDSYRERFYFGYRLHALVIRVDGIDLPLHIQLDGANTADVLLGVSSLARLERQLRELDLGARIEHAVFDAGYDADAFQRFAGALGRRRPYAAAERGA